VSVWQRWMDRALQLAAPAKAAPAPNPLVGAVVLAADGTLVGKLSNARARGAPRRGGCPVQAGERACGGTLVVKPGALLATTAATPPCSEP